jgi:phosphoribosylanthranilate isomerase
MTLLKICGITRAEDLACCHEHGVHGIGINLWPGSPRYLELERAKQLLHARAGEQVIVGVFVDPSVDEVRRAARELRLDVVQLHGDADPTPVAELALPWVQVVRGTPDFSRVRIPRRPPSWILLDARVPGFGGAGEITDWTWAATAVRHFAPLPVWLAGGIDPTNAARAIETVKPTGLDVASGAERAPGIKDADKIAALASVCAAR